MPLWNHCSWLRDSSLSVETGEIGPKFGTDQEPVLDPPWLNIGATVALLLTSFSYFSTCLLVLALFVSSSVYSLQFTQYTSPDPLALDKHHLSRQADVCASNSNGGAGPGLKNGIP